MTILNKDTLYYLATWSGMPPRKQVRNDIFTWTNYEDSTDLFYCFEFMSDNAFVIFPLDTLLSPEELNHIRSGKASLVLSNSHEAFHHIVKGIYNHIVIAHNIPPANVILISESADINTAVAAISTKLNVDPIRTRWSRRFEYDVQLAKVLSDSGKLSHLKLGEFPVTLEHKHYDKKYLCFNRRWRFHRPLLVALLWEKDLLKYGHVSLAKSDDNKNWESVYPMLLYMTLYNDELSVILQENDQQIKNLPDFYLDQTDLVTNRANLLESTHHLYSETYFSVVTETNFFTKGQVDTGRFTSEKTFKPIVYQHPFIAVTVPHFLDKVREVGYKTFSPWINEDYDTELDDCVRMSKIVKEIDRLSKLTPEELTLFLDGVREICKFNYDTLMAKTTFSTDLS